MALTIYNTAYMAEILRGAWAAQPREPIDAGYAFGFTGLRLHEDVAVLRSAAGAGDVELREAIEVAGGAPSGVALVVAVVGAGLGHTEGERGPDEDVSALVSAEHGVDFGGSLCMEESGGGDGKERCSVQNESSHTNVNLYLPSALT